jgi:two-component sensor histidine kinase
VAQQPYKLPAEADSILALIKVLDDKDKLDELIWMSLFYGEAETENLDSMRYYATEILQISEQYENEIGRVEALYLLGVADIFDTNYDKAKAYISKVISLSSEIDYELGLIKGYRKMGSVLSWAESYTESLKYFEKAYELARDNEELKSMAFDIAVDLGIEYVFLGFAQKSSKLLLDVLPYVEEPDISLESKGLFYETLGAISQEDKIFVDAISYYEQALDFYKKDNNKEFQISPLHHIGEIYFNLGKPQEAMNAYRQALELVDYNPRFEADVYFGLGLGYELLKQLEEAEEYFLKAVESFRTTESVYGIGVSMLYLGRLDLSRGNPSEARNYFNKASESLMQSIEKNRSQKVALGEIKDAYLLLSQIDSIRGDFEQSLNYYKRYVLFKDSINTESNIKAAERLEFAKEAAEKDKEIAVLENQNNVQRYEARQEKGMKIVLLIVVLMLVLFLVVVVRGFRTKQKALKIIGEKNEENKLLMREVHHRVKNNLQIILSLMNAQVEGHRDNKELGEVLKECQNKIQSMAILHQHLYQGTQFASVPVSSYLTELVQNIQKTFKAKSEKVEFQMEVDNTNIQVGLAVPLGLILNELVTNCYKYAFESDDEKQKRVSVIFKRIAGGHKFQLLIQDNGVGLPDDFSLDNLRSFGMQLVYGLVGQMNGEMKVLRDGGTGFDIYLEEPVAA